MLITEHEQLELNLENFKQELTEEFYGSTKLPKYMQGTYVELYKNPSSVEMNKIKQNVNHQIRGIFFKSGNLIVADDDIITHSLLLINVDIKNFDWHTDANLLKRLICIASYKKNPRKFYLAESYSQHFIDTNKKNFKMYVPIMKRKGYDLILEKFNRKF